MRVPVKGDDGPTKAIPVILRNIQRSDLSLLAAYPPNSLCSIPPAAGRRRRKSITPPAG
jgi:hypothetical protein